jgi:hypothetical protein
MNRLSIMALLVTSLFLPFTTSADAYHSRHLRHHYAGYEFDRQQTNRGPGYCTFTNDGRGICGGSIARPALARAGLYTRTEIDPAGNRAYAMVDTGTVIGSRPSGCPHSYCGCGLRKYLGLADERFNLASNWARLLPRESGPRAGVAAVRNHHVMYIESAAGNGQWLVRDYNSGGGLSRMHVRDVRGYVFVNPHGQTASRTGGISMSARAGY